VGAGRQQAHGVPPSHLALREAIACPARRGGVIGAMLAQIHHPASGPITAPPLVIAHGLFGSARNWGVIARRLADTREVIAVDMRNHGASPRAASHTYPDLAADLAQVIHAIGAPVDLLGHSMGGKAAMYLALSHGHLLRRLVVADIAPVAYAHDQNRNVQAMQALNLGTITTRAQADAALARHLPDPALRAFFLQSLDFRTTPPQWRLNLGALAANMPHIIGWPGAQGRWDGPALFLTGANSPYVQPDHRPLIQSLFPKARFAKLNGAGHWLHAEQPRAFEETLRLFLNA
jgi:esterase